jgi:hypothetical protein
MWDKVVKHLKKYPTAVLTGIDTDGYPYSIRCKAETDSSLQAIKIALPGSTPIQAGVASILCHYHDDLLWKQTNVVLRGTIERTESAWLFRPTSIAEGAGAAMSMIRQVSEGRRAAKKYLEKRGLKRPKIMWDKLKAIYDRAQQDKS